VSERVRAHSGIIAMILCHWWVKHNLTPDRPPVSGRRFERSEFGIVAFATYFEGFGDALTPNR
jgi:hypothetical protein